jgi:hypothetical protein
MHAAVKDEFIRDLAACAEIVRAPSARKTVTRLVVQTANGAARILPEAWMSRIMDKVSGLLGGSGSGLPSRMAPMYGLIGSLPNRGDLKELVLDLLDSMTRVSEQ